MVVDDHHPDQRAATMRRTSSTQAAVSACRSRSWSAAAGPSGGRRPGRGLQAQSDPRPVAAPGRRAGRDGSGPAPAPGSAPPAPGSAAGPGWSARRGRRRRRGGRSGSARHGLEARGPAPPGARRRGGGPRTHPRASEGGRRCVPDGHLPSRRAPPRRRGRLRRTAAGGYDGRADRRRQRLVGVERPGEPLRGTDRRADPRRAGSHSTEPAQAPAATNGRSGLAATS